MAILTYNDMSWEVDHAVLGENYVHGYDAAGNVIVAIDDTTDLDNIMYDGDYMLPDDCLEEQCNNVKYFKGLLVTPNGKEIGGKPFKLVASIINGDEEFDGCTMHFQPEVTQRILDTEAKYALVTFWLSNTDTTKVHAIIEMYQTTIASFCNGEDGSTCSRKVFMHSHYITFEDAYKNKAVSNKMLIPDSVYLLADSHIDADWLYSIMS